MTGPALFADVDRALVMAALAARLRSAGVAVAVTSIERATRAVGELEAPTVDDLYWATRVSLVTDRRDLPTFDRVFDAVFDTDHRARDGGRRGLRTGSGAVRRGDREHTVRIPLSGGAVDGGGLPWATLPSVAVDPDADRASDRPDPPPATVLPERRAAAGSIDDAKPFDLFDDDELTRLGALVEASAATWPRRRARRFRSVGAGGGGDRVELRASLRRARRTGGEAVIVARAARMTRPRRVAMLLDVSGSMESYARAYLHVARPMARAGRTEVFALGTDATRLTSSLRLRSAIDAIDRATTEVADRFGGTHLATSLTTVLRHRWWGSLVRGAVVVVVSDGWDSDPPARLDRAMARLARTAHRIVWVNPRLAADDFEPRVAGMATALPYCDHFLPGHSLAALTDVLAAVESSR